MKPLSTNRLIPPLEVIEAQLFAPSERILAQWQAGELSREQVAALEANPIAVAYRDATVMEEEDQPDTIPSLEPEIPEFIRQLIARKVASQIRFQQTAATPQAGQIRLVSRLTGPEGELPVEFPQPRPVLLLQPTADPRFWRGFSVASETAWAGWWDLLLEECDAPFDPQAAVVQIWNPVTLYSADLGAVVAELSSERLQAVRALEQDYLFGADPDPQTARPGVVIARESGSGIVLVTGTPLAAEDPRHRYQQLYHHAAQVLTVPARLWQAAEVEAEAVEPKTEPQTSWVTRATEWLQSTFAELGAGIPTLQPAVAYAMGEEAAQVVVLEGLVQCSLHPIESGRWQLQFTSLSEQPLTIKLRQPGLAPIRFQLKNSQREICLFQPELGGELCLQPAQEEPRCTTLSEWPA